LFRTPGVSGVSCPDPRPSRERFSQREADVWVLAVVDFDGVPAIIVTVFSTERAPA